MDYESLTEDYSKEDLENMIFLMEQTSKAFYYSSVKIGNHAFVEFTGLMNEYIKICQRMLKADIDFTNCSGHSGTPLILHPHELKYINEKLNCIFVGLATIKEVEPCHTHQKD